MEQITIPLRGYSEEPIFYVYVHKRPVIGTVFYVGKGHGKRAWVTKARNKHWHHVVEKHGGFDVEIVKDGMKEQEAFDYEKELILHYGMDNLTNQTLGGLSTTGFTHSEETKELQRQITLNRLRDNPEYLKVITESLAKLHDRQRNDPELREKMNHAQRVRYANLSDEEKRIHTEVRTAWLRDPVRKEEAMRKKKEFIASAEYEPIRKKISTRMKEIWASMSEEERLRCGERSRSIISRPDVREKLLEVRSDKIVVNRSFIFKSKREFVDHIGSSHAVLQKAINSAKKHGFSFCVTQGYFVEDFIESEHKNLPQWSGEQLKRLDFDCLPRSKAIVMDECRIFLSMNEASIFCQGKTVEATADFITKNMKRGKPAMGHMWRVASNQEIQNEILQRLEDVIE